ncbi:hypothetical protein CGLO_09232 [Colletotrichum gloeosporioides Cg-14]|nr:hypothetical protein CGLO_09232 [Colletotrichum gloeosporioides Cg-14]
MSQLKT